MISLFSGLITSKTRIRILMRLFMNPQQSAYMRELSDEFNVSPSQIKDELNQLSVAGFLTSKKNGRQILFSANQKHPLFSELNSMVRKALGMDKIIDSIVDRLGNLETAYLVGDYAEGKDTGIIDLVLVGAIDQTNLADLVTKTEKYIGRKIRTLAVGSEEFATMTELFNQKPILLLWKNGK
jgi:predicted nucleotidyltransferase